MRLLRRTERSDDDAQPLFFIHVMRTAGTSFRSMIEKQFDQTEIYPTAERIRQLGRYPDLADLLKERDRVLDAKFVVGHYPFVLRSLWPRPPWTFTFLRDPVERTVSILRFARLRRRQFDPSTPLANVFDDEELNAAMIRNYQTKVFSIPYLNGAKGVNHPIPNDSIRLDLAKERLEECDLVGLAERFEDSMKAFQLRTNIDLPAQVHTNRSTIQEQVDDTLRTRIMEATSLDAELVKHAATILARQMKGAAASPG